MQMARCSPPRRAANRRRRHVNRTAVLTVLALVFAPAAAQAQNLFQASSWPNVAGDLKASRIGDVLTVVVYQSTEARNAAQNSAARGWSADGDLNTDILTQNGEIGINSDYLG